MAISKIGSKALVDCSVAAVDIEDNSITSAKLAGSIANAKLANSSITVNGTSVSLGASGTIPAVSWQSVKTNSDSPVTLVAGNGYFMDTTSGVITATLPGSPSAGDTIAIKDYAGTFNTNNLTIGRNGNNIQGVANDSLITTNKASLILVYSDATKGWLYTVESNVADLEFKTYISATGGTITTSGDFKIHAFTGDGCFVVSSVGNPAGSDSVDYLVVAGGGASGVKRGGGGGGGGFRIGAVSVPCSAPPLVVPGGLPVSATTYPITVGAGGSGGTVGNPTNTASACSTGGSNSVFSTITSAGGGEGGGATPCALAGNAGFSGGSGGGGFGGVPGTPFCSQTVGGTGNTPPVSPPQGNNGGTAATSDTCKAGSGGGGGAAAVGSNGGPTTMGAGGGGSPVTAIFGCAPQPFYTANKPSTGETAPGYMSGGGGGGARNGASGGVGGIGGGGQGADGGSGVPGQTNSGGGGGGSRDLTGDNAGNGGKGIVLIRYKFQN